MKVRRVNQGLVLRSLAIAQGAVVGPPGEHVDALLHWRLDLQINDAPR